jgi:hypothetical protein
MLSYCGGIGHLKEHGYGGMASADVEGYPCPHSAENLDQWRWRMVQGLRRCAEIASDTRGLDAWSPIGVIQFVPSSRILNGMRTLLKTKGDDSLRDVFCCDRVTIGRFGLVLKHYEIPHPHPRLVRL